MRNSIIESPFGLQNNVIKITFNWLMKKGIGQMGLHIQLNEIFGSWASLITFFCGRHVKRLKQIFFCENVFLFFVFMYLQSKKEETNPKSSKFKLTYWKILAVDTFPRMKSVSFENTLKSKRGMSLISKK